MKREKNYKNNVIPEECCRESSSYGLLSKEEKQLHYTKYTGDPRQKLSGMTPYNTTASGFTLVELLVVVLIIGILAAVAVPQYQQAVNKSRFMTLVTFARAVKPAQESYYLTNGEYTENWEELPLSFGGEIKWGNYLYMPGQYFVLVKDASGDPDGLKGFDNKLPNIRLQAGWDQTSWKGKMACQCPEDDVSMNKLCQSISGKSTRDKGGIINDKTWYYYFF